MITFLSRHSRTFCLYPPGRIAGEVSSLVSWLPWWGLTPGSTPPRTASLRLVARTSPADSVYPGKHRVRCHQDVSLSDLVDDLPEDGPRDVLVLTELRPGEVCFTKLPSDGGECRPGRTDQSNHVGLGWLSVNTNIRHHRGGLQHGLNLPQTDVLAELKLH